MSFWTSIRDTVESVASVAGNLVAPGSSIITSHLTSKGSQEQLNSPLGLLAQAGSSYIGMGGTFGATTTDPATGIVSGGQAGVADAAGPGLTFDSTGEIVANEIGATEVAGSLAGSADAASASAISAVTDAEFSTASSLMKSGMSAVEAAKNALGSKATGSLVNGLIGALATGAGSLAQAKAATGSGQALAAASKQAAGVLAPAITNAAGIQSEAAKTAAGTLGTAATQGAATQAAGATSAANTLAGAATQASGIQSQQALASGQQLAAGYTGAAGQEVAGYRAAEDIARQTLAQQTANQRPYMEAGTKSLTTLSEGLKPGGQYNRPFTMADAQNSAAYQFALQQGKEAIGNASAAGGLQLSSANIQSLGKFAEGTAAQYEQQAFDQWMAQNNLSLGALQQMVNTGQISTNQLQGALAQAGISMETFESNIGRAQSSGTLGAAGATANAGQQSAAYQAGGINQAAGATAAGQEKAANYTAGGITGAANAAAAGDVSSAGYLAGGMTGAANATAQGITGAANAINAGNIAGANALSSGATAIGNQIAKSNVFSNIPQTPTYTLATGPGV